MLSNKSILSNSSHSISSNINKLVNLAETKPELFDSDKDNRIQKKEFFEINLDIYKTSNLSQVQFTQEDLDQAWQKYIQRNYTNYDSLSIALMPKPSLSMKQLDPYYNQSEKTHEIPPSIQGDVELINKQREINTKKLKNMWKKTDPSLNEQTLNTYIELLTKQYDLAAKSVTKMLNLTENLNPQQTAYYLAIHGENPKINLNNGKKSIHDCNLITLTLTSLEKSTNPRAWLNIYDLIREGIFDKNKIYNQAKEDGHENYVKSIYSDGNQADEDEDMYMIVSDRTYMYISFNSLNYSPIDSEIDKFNLDSVDEFAQVGDVLYIDDPKVSNPNLKTPSYHVMKIIGKKNNRLIVAQGDGANPDIPINITYLDDIVDKIYDGSSRVDIYRNKESVQIN
ncbi:MAG: hypothetical protein HRT47_06775 [Candidatus Caenarcaniphilales bacterium]|nr:hypothetical protein [Candidatus Caenarcaniphilales bacterium]